MAGKITWYRLTGLNIKDKFRQTTETFAVAVKSTKSASTHMLQAIVRQTSTHTALAYL